MPAVLPSRYPFRFPSYFVPRHLAHGRLGLVVPAQLITYALLLGFACQPVPAQGVPGNTSSISVGSTSPSDQRMRELEELANKMDERDSLSAPAVRRPLATCIMQPYPGLSNTVSLRSLEVQDKVQDEYQKACTALQSKKFAEAEKHLRKALQRSSPDALGWVMLGRVLEFMERLDEASKACGEAALHEPAYWPATVCLAEIDGRKRKWTDSLEESNRAVSLNPNSKRFAYYISAVALFNLNEMHDAESRALEAERLDRDHQLLSLRLLLARIDEVKGDRQAAVAQLRDCLNSANDAPEGKLAKQELARLEGAPN